jgi:hypothetical protein
MLEMVMNESVGLSGKPVYSSVLEGVKHNSKLRKLSFVNGLNADFRMWQSIAQSMVEIDTDGVASYLRAIRLRDTQERIT